MHKFYVDMMLNVFFIPFVITDNDVCEIYRIIILLTVAFFNLKSYQITVVYMWRFYIHIILKFIPMLAVLRTLSTL